MMGLKIENLAGSWALVTGASLGLGREFCLYLAQAGINIVAVARRVELLKELANHIEKHTGAQCLCVAMDLTETNCAEKLKDLLMSKGIRVRLLVNNAGINFYGRVLDMPQELTKRMLSLNTEIVLDLCRVFADDLESQAPSGIINVSSQAALNPLPGSAVYGATKAFLHQYSLALSEELKTKGIVVQTLVPGPMDTEGTKEVKLKFKNFKKWDNPAHVVKVSLQGLERGDVLVTTANDFTFQKIMVNVLPIKLVLKEVGAIFLKD